jgi:cytochrome c553
MADIVRELSSEDIHAVTAWLAAQEVPADAQPQAGFKTEPAVRCGSIEATRE